MNRCRVLVTTITGLALCAGMCHGQESSAARLKITPSGFASMELGEIVTGGVNSKTNLAMDNTWMKNLIAGLSVDAALSERNFLDIGMEMQMYNDFPITSALLSYPEFRYLYFYPYLSRAEYSHNFGDINSPYLTLSAGYFPFKYNNDVKNLGEYLFRTGTYPQYILNEFDFPLARLLGIHASITPHIPLNDLKIDVIAYSNLQWYAVGDWNLAMMASDKIADFLDVGLGATFNSLLSTDNSVTTPHNPATVYHITYNATTGTSDSSFYSFKGAKLMAKASIDLKKFISSNFFNKEDLRLYSEAAILGLTDYPKNLLGGVSYDSILERIPLTIGFNWPTNPFTVYSCALVPEIFSAYRPEHTIDNKETATIVETCCGAIAAGVGTWFLEKLLSTSLRFDAVSIETEWFGCRNPNDVGAITNYGLPIPGPVNATGATNYRNNSEYQNDNWKWSVHASRKFATNYTVMLQVASDHMRPLAVNDQNVDFEEIFHNTNQFYYMVKCTAGF